jgi:serine/threonine-protein kinase/endoribonuclease IRE1
MTHWFYVLLALLPVLILISASPSPDPYPAIVTAPHRSPVKGVDSQVAAPPSYDLDILPIVLISTIDGALHAVEREGGKVKWTLKDGVEPLVGGGGRGRARDEEYIVEPLSGELYVFEHEEVQGTPKVRKLPLSVEKL